MAALHEPADTIERLLAILAQDGWTGFFEGDPMYPPEVVRQAADLGLVRHSFGSGWSTEEYVYLTYRRRALCGLPRNPSLIGTLMAWATRAFPRKHKNRLGGHKAVAFGDCRARLMARPLGTRRSSNFWNLEVLRSFLTSHFGKCSLDFTVPMLVQGRLLSP